MSLELENPYVGDQEGDSAEESTQEAVENPGQQNDEGSEEGALVEGSQGEDTNEVAPKEDDSEEQMWQRLRIIAELKEVREHIRGTEDSIENHRSIMKGLKENLTGLKSRCDSLLDKLFKLDGPEPPAIIDRNTVDSTAKDVTSPGSNPQPNSDSEDSWRDIKSVDILVGIKGLGAKKLDALLDMCPTLGHLEDVRGQASREFKEFRELLPKGIGTNTAAAIEEAAEEAVRNWRADMDEREANVESNQDSDQESTEDDAESESDE